MPQPATLERNSNRPPEAPRWRCALTKYPKVTLSTCRVTASSCIRAPFTERSHFQNAVSAFHLALHSTASDITFGYGYTASGQLSHITRDNETYAWDGQPANPYTRNYTTNGLNQYESAGSASFCYDANGNLTADGGSVYLYDIENRLVEKRVQGGGNTNCASLSYTGALDARLHYDPLGRLYRYEGYTSGALSSDLRFLYDGDAPVKAVVQTNPT